MCASDYRLHLWVQSGRCYMIVSHVSSLALAQPSSPLCQNSNGAPQRATTEALIYSDKASFFVCFTCSEGGSAMQVHDLVHPLDSKEPQLLVIH